MSINLGESQSYQHLIKRESEREGARGSDRERVRESERLDEERQLENGLEQVRKENRWKWCQINSGREVRRG